MKIVLVNQFAPPDASPTARLGGEIGKALKAEGHRVTWVSCPPGYRERKRGPLRILFEGASWCGLFFRALRVCRADVWIVFSSPPLVLWVALLGARFRGGRVIHWVLDAYPDIAHNLGALPAGPLFRALRAWTCRGYRRCDPVVAVSEAMRDWLIRDYGVEAPVVHPWPPRVEPARPADWPPSGPRIWLYSGNLGRAHDWETLLEVQAVLEAKGAGWRLILQGGGSGWEAARREAADRGLRGIHFQPYVAPSELLASLQAADVRVVTCRHEAAGLLWPSKLALLRAVPGPHLWIGPPLPEGDLGSGFTSFRSGEVEAIAAWLQSLKGEPAPMDGATIEESIDRLRQQGVTFWKHLVNGSRKLPG